MSNSHEIKTQPRNAESKGASRRLRRAGQIPAIVYGDDQAPVNVQLNHNEIWLASLNDWFYSSILKLNIDGKLQSVLLRDMQRHPYKQLILHLDFLRVNDNKVLRATVPFQFINEEKSPAGKSSEVLVTHELKEVHIECLPKYLPQAIVVDLGELKAGDAIHLSNIKLPEGVEIPQLKLSKEHDDAVVIAKQGKVEEVVAPVAAAPAKGKKK